MIMPVPARASEQLLHLLCFYAKCVKLYVALIFF